MDSHAPLPPHDEGPTDDVRRRAWFAAGCAEADVLVIGGGVMGARACHGLAQAGLRVVLAEKHDFASGTSQASAGLVWGGLIYLRNGYFREAVAWCRQRRRLLGDCPDAVRTHDCMYRPDPVRRSPALVRSFFFLYGMLDRSLSRPRMSPDGHILFQEAKLAHPDARFTWEWVAAASDLATAFNRCEAESFAWDGARWRVRLKDLRHGGGADLSVRWVVNAAGPWAETLDRRAGVDHGYAQFLSRGVSLVVPGNGSSRTLICEHPDEDDLLSLVPFGPGAIWGSTETMVDSPEAGFAAPQEEVESLLDWHGRSVGRLEPHDVLAVRCGVRALAVPAAAKAAAAGKPRSQNLARAFKVLADSKRPWLSLYGGKLSGCAAVADQVVARITGREPPPAAVPPREAPPSITLAGLTVPDPAFCRDREQCASLDDYLRRRTPVAQWVHRAGAGQGGEYLPDLARIALTLAGGDAVRAKQDFDHYLVHAVGRHDRLLGLARSAPGVLPCPS